MGQKGSTINNTVYTINSGAGAHSGDVGQDATATSSQSQTTDVSAQVPLVPALLANKPSGKKGKTKAKGKLPKPDTKKAVDAVAGSGFLDADEKTQRGVAPFTGAINKIGDALPNKNGKARNIKLLGALAGSYEEAKSKWQDGKPKDDDEDGGYWDSAFDDVHSIVKEKAGAGDDDDDTEVYKHLGEIMGSVISERAKIGVQKYTSSIKTQLNWVSKKQKPGQGISEALDDMSDSDDEEDRSAKEKDGKARNRKGKLAGLRNLAAKANGSRKDDDEDDDDQTNGVNRMDGDDSAEKKSRSLPVRKGKKKKAEDEDEKAASDEEEDEDEDEEDNDDDEEDEEDDDDEDDDDDEEDGDEEDEDEEDEDGEDDEDEDE